MKKSFELGLSLACLVVGSSLQLSTARAQVASDGRSTKIELEIVKETEIEIAQENTDKEKTAEAERIVGQVLLLYQKGIKESLQEAIPKLEQALLLFREVGNREMEAFSLWGLGGLYYELGEAQKALDYYNQALPIFREVENREFEAIILNNLGLVYDSLGDPQKSLDYYNQALTINREIGDRDGEASNLNNIGFFYDNLGELQQALDYYNQALTINREIGDREREATALNNIGQVYDNLGEPEKAFDFHNQSLIIEREIGNSRGEAITLNNIAGLEEERGNLKEALDFYNQSLTIAREVGDRSLEATTLNNIGQIYDFLGEPEKALDFYNQSLIIEREIGKPRGEATTLSNLAFLERDRGNLQEALANIEAAIELVEQIRTNIISPELKTSFFSTVEDYYKLKIEILMELHQEDSTQGYDKLAFETSERGKARTLLDLLTEANIDIRKGVEPQLLERETNLRRRLESIEQRRVDLCSQGCGQEQLDKLETEREELLGQYRKIQTEIRAKSPEYAELTQPEPLSLEEVQQLLDEDTVLLQYSLGEERSYVWALSKNDFIAEEIAGAEKIESAANEFYQLSKEITKELVPELASNNKVITPEASGRELSQLILEPIAQKLNKKRIVVVGDGILHYIPFASIPFSNGLAEDNLLMDSYQIVNLPSSSVLQRLRQNERERKPAAKQIAVLADPVFEKDDKRLETQEELVATKSNQEIDSSNLNRAARSIELYVERLPGTEEEAKAILQLFKEEEKKAAYGFAANRSLAISGELSQYQIVHMATHGIANSQRPELSGVILSLFNESGQAENGFLRLHDVFNLNLPAELVVLSACQTGLGQEVKGEGIVGLTRGFMYAGANKLVVSLWDVPDDATAALMTKFYQLMLEEKLAPAEALRQAQQEIRQEEQWQHPMYWAAFTLQGDW